MVIMNAATSIIVDKSPYCVRTSFTLPMTTTSLGNWAAKNGIKKAYTMVSDLRARSRFGARLHQLASRPAAARSSARSAWPSPIRTSPLTSSAPRTSTRKRSSCLFRAARSRRALGKALAERGIDTKKVRVMGTQELTDDSALVNMGDTALGIISAGNYDHNLKSKMNQDFRRRLQERIQRRQSELLLGRRL